MKKTKVISARILFADSKADTREEVTTFLNKSYNFQVDAVTSGTEVLEKIRQAERGHYNIILLNQSFDKGPDALEVLIEIKKFQPDIPLILFIDKEFHIDAEALKKEDLFCMVKPFSNEKLASVIHAILHHSSDLKQIYAVRVIEQLSKIGQELTVFESSPEVLKNTLEQIAKVACEMLGADIVDLYQYQPDLETFTLPPIIAGKRLFPNLIPMKILPDDVIIKFAKDMKTLYTSDAQTDEILAGEKNTWKDKPKQRFVTREKIASSAVIPLKVRKIGKEVLFGILFVSYRHRRDFDAEIGLKESIESFAGYAAIAIETARLLQHEKHLDLLREVSKKISATLDLDEIMSLILKGAIRLTGASFGDVHLIDHKSISVSQSFEYPDNFRHPAPRLSEGKGLTRTIMETGNPVIIPDITEDSRANKVLTEKGVRSLIGVPLKLQERVIGVLYLNYPGPHQYTEEEKSLLFTLSDQAAISIGNARLIEKTKKQKESEQQRANILSLLQKIVARINTTLDFEESLEHIVKGAVELVSVNTAGVIHLFDTDRQNIPKSYAYPESFVHAPRFPDKKALTWQIFETGELIEIPDISESSRVSAAMHQSKVKSIIGVPLKLSGSVIGVLYLKALQKHKFTQDEKTVLTMLCEHAALVIEKARRYEHLDLLREVSGKINATLDLKEIMPLILRGAIRLTEATFGDVHLIDQKNISVSHSFEYPDNFRHPAPRLSEGKGLTRTIMETGNPVIIPDIAEDSRANKVLTQKGVRSLIGVPMKLRERVIGVLYLNYPRPHQYTEEEKSLLFTLSGQAAISIGNARLFEKTKKQKENEEQRANTLNLLQKIVARINITLDFEESLKHIVKGAVELISVNTAGVIHLFDTDRQNIAESYAYPESFVHAPRFPDKKALTWQIFVTGELIEIPDVSKSSRVSEEMHQSDVKSIIGVPLKLSGGVIGVLYLKVLEKHEFTQDEKTVLTMLCEHAALVIEKARRYEHLDLLRKVSGKISATLDLDEIMSLILEGAIGLTGANFGDVHLIDQKKISVSRSFEYPKGFNHPAPRLSEGKGLTWTIMQTGNPVIIADITEDSRANRVLTERGVRSLIGVPLKLQEKVIGVLYLNYPRPHQYTEEEKSLLFTLSDQAAISIENARLFEETKKQKDDEKQRANTLNLLQDIVAKINSTLNFEESLKSIVKGAVELVSVNTAGVIHLFDIARQNIVKSYASPESFDHPVRFSEKTGLTWEIFNTGESIEIPDISESTRVSDAMHQSQVKSIIGVPLKLSDKVIGVLYLKALEQHEFTQEEKTVLTMLSEHASLVIEKARRYEQIKALYDIGQKLNAELNYENLLQLILERAKDIIPFEVGTISLIDEKLNQLVLKNSIGSDKGVNGTIVQMGEGITGWVAKYALPLCIPDVRNITPVPNINEQPTYFELVKDTKSELCVPLLIKKDVIGVINVESSWEGAFNTDDKERLETLANQAAIAIENAMLVGKMKKRVQEWDTLRELAEEISSGDATSQSIQ